MAEANSRTVPLQANDKYKTALSLYAKRNKISMAALVRQALDLAYGKGIEQEGVSFFGSDAYFGKQSGEAVSDENS